MNNFAASKKLCTREEYFALEESSGEKYEFEHGEVFAMSGGSADQSLLAGNIITALKNKLADKNCRVFGSDIKVTVDWAESYVYPDAMVICGKIEYAHGRNDIFKNPVLLIEMLSSSPESYDRGKKFKKYQTLPSFKEYVLISKTEPAVKTFVRQEQNHWLYTLTEGMEASLQVNSINALINLTDIYRKVEFGDEQ